MSLDEKLRPHEALHSRFVVARDFVRTILSQPVPQERQALQSESDFYTDHGIGHLERVLEKLAALAPFLAVEITPRELFLLLVAAYCHDLGMFLGRRDGEDPSQTRREHHIRSAELVRDLADDHRINLQPFELPIVQSLIKAHRIINLDEIQEEQQIGNDRIRTQLLGALLRIADACDIDHRRAPEAIFAFYEDLMPPVSRERWRQHQIVSGVHFDQRRSSVVVSVDLDGSFCETIERTRIANAVRRELEREMQSVFDVFSRHNVGLVHVDFKDFFNQDYIDFTEFPLSENFVLLQVNTNTQSFESLYTAIQNYLLVGSGPSLVIHIGPVEGPLYIDTRCRVGPMNLTDVERAARESLGNEGLIDFRHSLGPEVVKLSDAI